METILVGLIMGSKSDWETMRHAAHTLETLGIAFEARVVSAHRTPHLLYEYSCGARERGIEVIIAGAGGAAHLPGMTASMTSLPVLGVPVESKALKGMDSLLSIVQMPAGIPVATLAIGRAGAINAALLAASILANKYPDVLRALDTFRAAQTEAVLDDPDPREDGETLSANLPVRAQAAQAARDATQREAIQQEATMQEQKPETQRNDAAQTTNTQSANTENASEHDEDAQGVITHEVAPDEVLDDTEGA